MKVSRFASLVSLALVGSLSMAACGGDGDSNADDPETETVTETPGADETTTPSETSVTPIETPTTMDVTISPTGEVDPEELAEDLDSAVAVTLDWWTRHWADYFTGTYTPPTVVGLYDGYDPATAPTCGGVPLDPDNAWYCSDGDYVAWDKSLMELAFELGDAWPYLIVAHEWGHSIQARLSVELQDDQRELQADCLAGAVLYGAAAEGTLEFEEGDEKEIVDGLNYIADELPWGMSGDHGDSFQRIEAFNLGRSGGVPGCLPDTTG